MLGPQDHYVLDASFDTDDTGFFCFCPVELDGGGQVTSILTGLSYLSTEPPEGSRFLGVVHEDGQEACEKWCADNEDAIRDLRERFGDLVEAA